MFPSLHDQLAAHCGAPTAAPTILPVLDSMPAHLTSTASATVPSAAATAVVPGVSLVERNIQPATAAATGPSAEVGISIATAETDAAKTAPAVETANSTAAKLLPIGEELLDKTVTVAAGGILDSIAKAKHSRGVDLLGGVESTISTDTAGEKRARLDDGAGGVTIPVAPGKKPIDSIFQTLGDFIAGEEPVITPDGRRDYYTPMIAAEKDVEDKVKFLTGIKDTAVDSAKAVKEFAIKTYDKAIETCDEVSQAVDKFADDNPKTASAVKFVAEKAVESIPYVGPAIKATKKVQQAQRGLDIVKELAAAVKESAADGPTGLIPATAEGVPVPAAVAADAETSAAVGAGATAEIGTAAETPLALSMANRGGGKNNTPRAGGPERSEPVVERKVDTPEIQNKFWDEQKKSGEWEHVHGYNKPTLRHKKTGRLIQKSKEKWEIEVFDKNDEHIGVIKPSDGILRTNLKVDGRSVNK
jgi:hypothetical protein